MLKIGILSMNSVTLSQSAKPMRTIFLLICYCCTSFGFGQTDQFTRGQLLDGLPVATEGSETYALYLPTSYDASIENAVVFIFDPSGSGKNGIRPFITASEKFNYVLVCSNVTKNGVPYPVNFGVTSRLLKTIFAKFSIDKNQLYTAGFSGGSRLASAIAAVTGKVQGVIACGAGLPVDKTFTPSAELFSYVALVGDEDMNYQEMFTTKAALDQYEVPNELLVYEDSHRWPPKEQLVRAFSWLELQAYEKKLRMVDSTFVKNYYESQYEIADSLAHNHYQFRAVHEYKSLINNFSNYYTLDSIQAKIDHLENTKEYQQEVVTRASNIKEENARYEVFSTRFTHELIKAKSFDNYKWWKKEIGKLTDEIEAEKNNQKLKMLKRLRYTVYAGIYESSVLFTNSKKYQHALYCDHVLIHFRPKQAYWFYRLAESYARNNDLGNTITYLKKAKELGLQGFERVENAPVFAKYKDKRKFKKLFRDQSK
ncbi:hypothetical protein [Kordia sp.]|uniref:hypothetical protein n=1 Tax=Kordia sp. TaxID=1965332 RepID=UPI003D2A9BF0